MSDNIRPCPHCNGTGEIHTAWYVIDRYQDGSDVYGPFVTREEAEARYPPDTHRGCYGVNRDYQERAI